MARIVPLSDAEAGRDHHARAALEAIRSKGGRVTNMKRTLAREPVALRALLTWYDLRDMVQPFLGDRLTTLFAHAISARTDCLVCSTFFRRLLVDSGEDPDSPRLDDWEQAVVDYGRQLGADPNRVSDELYARLAARLEPDQIVALTAFGGLMVATNLFNNALQVDLDDYLQPQPEQGSGDRVLLTCESVRVSVGAACQSRRSPRPVPESNGRRLHGQSTEHTRSRRS
jgi:alkylhydroperoxidase family enzyme